MKTTLNFLLVLILLSVSNLSSAQGPGKAISLDGNDDYIECGTNNRGITSTITAEAWVKTSSYKYHWIVGKYDRDAQGGYHLIIKEGKAAFAGRDGSGIYKISGYSSVLVNDNQWHHLAGVSENGTWQIYVDGILQNQLVSGYNATNLTSTAMMAIGKDFLANNENYKGQVDEVRIWKRALSQDEIRQNMCQKVLPTSTDLVAYFNLNDGTGSTIQDLSASKINGTFKNMSPSSAWVISGAPIGDISVYRYTNKWDSSLELVTTNVSNFSVLNVDPTIMGFHLYKVNSPPAQTNGINNAQTVDAYFGVFKVGNSNKKYKVSYKDYALTCGITLYRRSDNTASSWQAVADTINSPVIRYNNAFNYGEFAITSRNLPSTNTEASEYLSCNDTPVTLKAPISQNSVYLWSNGQTSQAIQVKAAGTYSVTTTTSQGCQIITNFNVEADECPIIPNIITPNNDGKNDTFVVGGLNIDNIDIEIFNRWGKSIYKRSGYDNTWTTGATGIYYYNIKSRLTKKDYKGWLEVVK
ncbi:LamG-like jellyroll fold domain-containing protein [Pontibacter populi]|uniref:LamG-like jellyroll fold domain-containing protein n=1 Tax=Pontibacter populi TaxID=890055 RepID=A0ABV1RWI9_9BACT